MLTNISSISTHKPPSFAGAYMINCSRQNSNAICGGITKTRRQYGDEVSITGGCGKFHVLTGQDAKDERILNDLIRNGDLMIPRDGKEPALSLDACTAIDSIDKYYYEKAKANTIDLRI